MLGRLNDRRDGIHLANGRAHRGFTPLAIVAIVIQLIKGFHLAPSEAQSSHLLYAMHGTLPFYHQQKQV